MPRDMSDRRAIFDFRCFLDEGFQLMCGFLGAFVMIGVIATTAIVMNSSYTVGYDANFCGPGTYPERIGPPPDANHGDSRVSQCLPNGVSLNKPEPAK